MVSARLGLAQPDCFSSRKPASPASFHRRCDAKRDASPNVAASIDPTDGAGLATAVVVLRDGGPGRVCCVHPQALE